MILNRLYQGKPTATVK